MREVQRNPDQVSLLGQLLSHQNPYREEYDRYIAQLHHEGKVYFFQSDLARQVDELIRDNPELREFLHQRMRGRTLLDLGGGNVSWLRKEAYRFEASLYLNVDADTELGIGSPKLDPHTPVTHPYAADDHFMEISENEDGTWRRERIDKKNTEVIEVRADMLDLLSRMQPNSAHIMIVNINFSLINDSEYHKKLAREIARVCGTDHVCFGMESDVFFYGNLEREGMKPVELPSLKYSPLKVYMAAN